MRMRGVVRAARARRRPHPPEVAGAVAQQRRGLAAQVSPHELAARAVLERHRLAAVRVDQLEHGVVADGQVHPLALARTRPPIVDQTSLIPKLSATRRAPRRLDLAPHGGEPRARLARRDDVADAERSAAPRRASRARAAR